MTRVFIGLAIAVSLLGCGESDKAKAKRLQLMDEAHEVGFAMGLAERCGLDHRWSRDMPSRYDDSTGEGKLEAAFASGYGQARALERPCIYGITGRPQRR